MFNIGTSNLLHGLGTPRSHSLCIYFRLSAHNGDPEKARGYTAALICPMFVHSTFLCY